MMTRSRATGRSSSERGQALWRAMTVRHRAAGHVRFDLPTPLRDERAAMIIETRLREIEGVYRVTVFIGLGKLSIQWDETVCDLKTVARALAKTVESLDGLLPVPPVALPAGAAGERPPRASVFARLAESPPFAALRERYEHLRIKADFLASHLARKLGREKPLPFDAKDWAIHFINDLVAFYLIRVHWTRITTQWMPRPWAYRYQWLTIIYLTFLLVRHRKATMPKPKK